MMLAAAHVSIRLAAIVAAALFFGGAFSMLGSITLNHKPDRTKFAPAPEPFIAYPLPPSIFHLSSRNWIGESISPVGWARVMKRSIAPIFRKVAQHLFGRWL
jgi:hypothetical protein